MRYVFFGTPEFAAIILEKLIHAGLPPVALVTNPDRPVGRKKLITPPPAKVIAETHHGIAILQPETLKGFDAVLKGLEPELCVVAAYGKIIPPSVLAVPRLGTIGVHPSLLPAHRGASPIQTAIRNGDTVTGVTLFLADAKVDHGETLAMAEQPLTGTETYPELERTLAEAGADLLIRILPLFVAGKLAPAAQNETASTFTKKFETEDGFVEWRALEAAMSGARPSEAIRIERLVRALNPEPGVWTVRTDGRRMKVLATRLHGERLELTRVQYAGGKPAPFA